MSNSHELLQAALQDPIRCAVFNCLNDGIMIVDADGIVVYVNDIYEKITGENKTYILHKPVQTADPGAVLSLTLSSKRATKGTVRDLNGYLFMTDTSPIFSDGELIGAVSIVYTIDSIIRKYEGIAEYRRESSAPAASAAEPASEASREDMQQIQSLLAKHGRSLTAKKLIAKEMGISLATLYNRLREYNIK